MYWTEGSTPLPRGSKDTQDQKTAEERAKEQKDLYDSVGLGDEENSLENESYDLLLVGEEKKEQNSSNIQNDYKEVGTEPDEDFALEIDEGDSGSTEELAVGESIESGVTKGSNEQNGSNTQNDYKEVGTESDEDFALEIDEGDNGSTEELAVGESSESRVIKGSRGVTGTVSDSGISDNEGEGSTVISDQDGSRLAPVQLDGFQPQQEAIDQDSNKNSSEVVAVQETNKEDRVVSIQDICAALTYIRRNFKFLPEFNNEKLNLVANLKASYSYLCNNNGRNQNKLKNNSYDGINTDEATVYVDKIFDKENLLTVTSYAAYGTATRDDETTLEAYDYVNKNYCTTFERYSKIYGPEYVKDITKLDVLSSFSNTATPNIHTTQGCSYHLVSSTIAGLITPEYNGVSFLSKFLGGKLLIEVNYITKSVSTIKDLLTVTVAYKDKEGYIQSFSYRYSSAYTYGLHSKFVSAFTVKAQEITRNRLLALKGVTSRMKNGELK